MTKTKNNMENEKLQNAVDEIKKLAMTSAERARVLQNIFDSAPLHEKSSKPTESPYMKHIFISIWSNRQLMYSLSALCLVVILSGGTVFASMGSLPGNILYPLKVNVVEPARGALIVSPLAKVEYQNTLVTNRLTEAETLASRGELDEPKEEEINTLLESHTIAFNNAVNDLRKNKNTDDKQNDDVVTNFQATLNAHARILNTFSKHTNDTEIEQEVETKISKKARDNAKSVRDNYKNNQKKQKNPEQEIEKENDRQGHMETQDQKQEDESATEDAHEKFLDSESSVKEAKIFLKAGAIFKKSGL